MENLEEMKVTDLKKMLKQLGLSTSGLKKDLQERLQMHMEKKKTEESDDESDEDKNKEEDEQIEETETDVSEDESVVEKDDEENETSEIIEVEASKPTKSVDKQNGIRGKNYDYDFVRRYLNSEEALNALVSENFWSKGNRKETKKEKYLL